MDCNEARQLIEAGVEPGTRPGQRIDLGFHLATCAACRGVRERFVPARAVAASARAVAHAPEPARVVQPEVLVLSRRRVVWLLPILLLLLLAAIGWYWGLPLLRAWGNLRAMSAESARTLVAQPTPALVAAARMAAVPIATPSVTPSAAPTTTPTQAPSATATGAVTASAAALVAQTAAVISPTAILQPSPTARPPAGMTVLLLGIDARPSEGVLARSDSIILARLDPQRHVVGLMSLPRDLWVTIPGGGEGKINSAFYLGEAAGAGGGPPLARKVVSTLLGIPIDASVVVDFRGFRGLINSIGGITVDVPTELYDPQFPTEDYGYMTAHFLPGSQHMNGDQALIYSRVRHPDSDFQRMRRQQAVLVGVAQALRQQGVFTTIHQADTLTAALRPYVHTDLAPEVVLSMLWSLRDTDPQQIKHIAVDTAYLSETSIGGAYALVGNPQVLHQLGAALINGTQP